MYLLLFNGTFDFEGKDYEMNIKIVFLISVIFL